MCKSIHRACLLAVVACVFGLGRAHAQGADALAGTWSAGAVTSDVAIESWSDACEAAPKARSSAGGAVLEIEARGQNLAFRGGGVELRNGGCGTSNPKLRHLGTNASDGLWVTRCATAPGDPHEEQGTYTLRSLGPDRLLYQDVTHLNWKLGGAQCRATVTTKQSLVRKTAAARASNPPPPPAQPPAARPTPAASSGCRPGAIARISLRPRESQLQLGEKLCLQARAEDAAGCAVPDPKLVWSLEHGPAIRGSLQGNCFQAGDRSAESEGHFEVLAEVGAVRGRATVLVVAHNLRELTARRVDTVGVPSPQESAPPHPHTAAGAESTTTRFAARALGQTERVRQRLLMGAAALLAVVAAVLALSRRSKRPSDAPNPPHQPTRRCPNCGAMYPDSIAFCGNDGTALAPVRRS